MEDPPVNTMSNGTDEFIPRPDEGDQLDSQSVVVQSVGMFVGSPLSIAGKMMPPLPLSGSTESRVRICLVILVAVVVTTPARGEWGPNSRTDMAVDRVGIRLAKGDDRQKVLDEFNVELQKHAKTDIQNYGKRLSVDLAASVKTTAKAGETDPVKRLAETKFYRDLLNFYANPARFEQFVQENPDDPATQIMKADHKIIERLLPLLHDRAPTRGYGGQDLGDAPHVPRVCDCVMTLIHYHSLCYFFDNSSGGWFHTYDQYDPKKDVQKEVIEEVNAWWKACRDKSVTEGLLAHLPRATERSQTLMVRNLVMFGRKGDDEVKKSATELAMGFLRRPDQQRFDVAYALAHVGDWTAVDLFYDELRAWPEGTRISKNSHLRFLTRFGGRREWALLIESYPTETVDAHVSEISYVGFKTPYAIPILGEALSWTKVESKRNPRKGGSYSIADGATEHMQTQTGMEFGYLENTPEPQRAAAIKKAQHWWATEGKSKYTLEYIEKELIRKK